MSIAPPTPPPTTSVEIQDSAEAPAAEVSQSQQPTQPTPSAGPDPYQVAFMSLVQIAGQGNWHELARTAEEVDRVTTGGDHQATRLVTVVPLVLAYLIEDETSPARYALQRLPDSLARHQLVGLLEVLTTVTTNRSHSKVYATASSIAELVEQSDFFDRELGSLVKQMLTRFTDAFRLRTFRLLSKAYSSLPVKLAQEYLGVSADTIINEARAQGWRYDAAKENLLPQASVPTAVPQSYISSLSTLHFVADSVGTLEA